jgi:hypothetical protein
VRAFRTPDYQAARCTARLMAEAPSLDDSRMSLGAYLCPVQVSLTGKAFHSSGLGTLQAYPSLAFSPVSSPLFAPCCLAGATLTPGCVLTSEHVTVRYFTTPTRLVVEGRGGKGILKGRLKETDETSNEKVIYTNQRPRCCRHSLFRQPQRLTPSSNCDPPRTPPPRILLPEGIS